MLFRTLGCKQNQFDTQALRCHFLGYGWLETKAIHEADWIVLNTCAVTERALTKARGEIGRLRRLNPMAKMVALGCGVLYNADVFSGVDYLGVFPTEIEVDSIKVASDTNNPADPLAPPHGLIPTGRSRGLLRIQSGCDQHCAYCIVPKLRGSSRSVSTEECLSAWRDLKQQAAAEIVLTGTNIALWGRDLAGAPNLKLLLQCLLAEDGNARLRLSSLEPQSISPDFLIWCLQQPQLCRHFHVALQSGSQKVRQLMKRAESAGDVLNFLKDFKGQNPDVALGADVIVGFPGETEADFQVTLDYVKSVPFSYLHIFPYSERLGTAAVDFAGSVPISERQKRAQRLRELDRELRKCFQRLNCGINQDIVTLQYGNKGRWEGLTSNYLRVGLIKGGEPQRLRFTAPIEISENRMFTTLKQ